MNETRDRIAAMTSPDPIEAPGAGGQPWSTAAPAHSQPVLARTPGPDPRAKSPALACVLSLMPGLGQVYVGYYPRGFAHAVIVGSLIALLGAGGLDELFPLMGLFLAFFWLYNVIDAGRKAALLNLVLAGAEAGELPKDFTWPRMGGSIFGGLLLLAVGFVLLLHTLFDVPLDWIERWWPIAPMAMGLWLLVLAVLERSGRGRS